MNQLFAENKMGYRAGERAHGKEDHAPGYPLGPVTLAAVVCQQQGGSDLTDLRGRHDDARRFRLDLEELLYCRDDRHEVRVVHTLKYLRKRHTPETAKVRVSEGAHSYTTTSRPHRRRRDGEDSPAEKSRFKGEQKRTDHQDGRPRVASARFG